MLMCLYLRMYRHMYTHKHTHTHTQHTQHTHTQLYIHILYPPVWFDPPEAMVAVGSSVTITCRSNQRATLELAYALQTILASSDGRSVSHHLVHVKEEDAGTIFCVGRVETPQAHKVVAFHLTVCKLCGCVMWTACKI